MNFPRSISTVRRELCTDDVELRYNPNEDREFHEDEEPHLADMVEGFQ